ncbi:MAG: DUF2283 domain-containing protein [Candidatus Nanohaloarchaea archaeon]|nr:DUF2283 domain-containing protein [Candidatus Nanohaloarchaea archaeon]
MEYEYDPDTDTLLIRLRDGRPESGEQEGNIITHFGADDRPVQIEILNATDEALGMIRAMLPHHEPVSA